MTLAGKFRHPLLTCWIASLVLAWAGFARSFSAEEANPVRRPWTTSRVVGSPDPPPPYKIVRAFPNATFNKPLLLARSPGDDRIYVGEELGVLYSLANRPDAKPEVFCDLRKEIQTIHLLPDATGIDRLYGLAFHPQFQQNRQCFVCYTLSGKKAGEPNLADGTRISRFLVTKTDPPRIDPTSEEVVLTFLQGGHNGGDLHFGPDGMLYISTGDATSPNPPDALNTGQDVSDLLSSILRIDVDHKDEGKHYAVPNDNPFIHLDGARPEIWAYGFRNPWRMSFDRATGELFVGDVGWELWEMIHRIEKGGNYGWSATEGPQPIKPDQIGPTPIQPALIELPHTIACSVTGGFVYRGKKFPELQGAYVFGDWETRRLWAARFEGDRVREMPEIARPIVRVVAFGEDQDGELYFLDHDTGTIHTFERNDAGSQNIDFPKTLSATGLFSSVEHHQAADGVVPFLVNGRQWQDGAMTEHWVALPGLSHVTLHDTPKPIPGMVSWHNFRVHFPKDAVLMRTMSLGTRRLETQILHYDGMDWRGYSYAWRDDQTDADLVPADGAEKEFSDHGHQRIWQFQSRSQCMSCHSNHSEYALAFLPEQLNRPGTTGRNQLIDFTEKGLIQRADKNSKTLPPFDVASAKQQKKIIDPMDDTQTLEERCRAYLHTNCGHCHSDHGGGAVPLRLHFTVPAPGLNAIAVRPARGDFGLPDAHIISPGDPYSSTLYFRMAKFGRDRMPHIGSDWPDEDGLALVERWIKSLESSPPATDNGFDSSRPDSWLATHKSAMISARMLGRSELTAEQRRELLSKVAELPPGPMRDLFDGYLAALDKTARKLGSSPRPKSILNLAGNAQRGETLFWSQHINCGKCHRLGDRGSMVGPDLSKIGAVRSRDDLLESILTPSRRIEPKFATYIVQTTAGRLLNGVLVKRDENVVVLRDNQATEILLPSSDVQEMRPVRNSLMPDGQMAGLTAQEAADLLEYLATRK